MPKKSQALIATDREVAGAKRPTAKGARAEYRIAGSPNLVLRVTCEGKRSWVYWIKRPKTSRWQKYTIGSYPAITLALARQEAVRLKRLVIEGSDPIDERVRIQQALTVKVLGEKYITRHARPKKRSWEEDERKLKREVYPRIGNLIAEEVAKSDLVGLLDRIRDRGAPIQANRVLALVRKLFNWAVAEGYLQSSPALGIPARSVERIRTRILDAGELRSFWRALDAFDDATADVLRTQLLLGARVREVTGMAKSELALNQSIPTWTLPKARAKGNRDVVRLLPPASLAIIRRRLSGSSDTNPSVFSSPVDSANAAITARAPSRALQRAAARGLVPRGFTPHDLRRTCRTGLAALGVPEIVAKKILGHAPPRSDVTASVYDQHTYVPEMMEALQRWEAHVMEVVHEAEQSPSRVSVSPEPISTIDVHKEDPELSAEFFSALRNARTDLDERKLTAILRIIDGEIGAGKLSDREVAVRLLGWLAITIRKRIPSIADGYNILRVVSGLAAALSDLDDGVVGSIVAPKILSNRPRDKLSIAVLKAGSLLVIEHLIASGISRADAERKILSRDSAMVSAFCAWGQTLTKSNLATWDRERRKPDSFLNQIVGDQKEVFDRFAFTAGSKEAGADLYIAHLLLFHAQPSRG